MFERAIAQSGTELVKMEDMEDILCILGPHTSYKDSATAVLSTRCDIIRISNIHLNHFSRKKAFLKATVGPWPSPALPGSPRLSPALPGPPRPSPALPGPPRPTAKSALILWWNIRRYVLQYCLCIPSKSLPFNSIHFRSIPFISGYPFTYFLAYSS